MAAGEQPGYRRFQGSDRYTSLTYPTLGEHGGARMDNSCLVLSTIGSIALRWSRPLEGTHKTIIVVRVAAGWCVACPSGDVPTQLVPLTGRVTDIAVGLQVFPVTAAGEVIAAPRQSRRAEKWLARAQRGLAAQAGEQTPQEDSGVAGQSA
jgi:putative transposase